MRRAEQVLERSGDVADQAAVKFSLGSLLAWGLNDLEPGRELVSRARKLFSEAGDERSVLVATNELGYHVGMADDGDEHERIATEVLAAAEQADDPALQLQALCSLAWALSLKGRIEPSLEVIGRGIDVARQADKTYRLCYLLGMGASLENFLGRSHHTAQLDAAKEMHPSYRDTLLLDFTAQIALQAGDLDGVVAAYHDQMAWDGGLSTRRAFGAAMAVQALSEMGRHGEAADILQTASVAFRGRRCWILSRLVDWAAGVGVVLSGGAEAGVARLAGVVEDAIEQSYWLYARWMLVDLAEAAVSGGDEPTAIRAARAVAPRSLAPRRTVPRRRPGLRHRGGLGCGPARRRSRRGAARRGQGLRRRPDGRCTRAVRSSCSGRPSPGWTGPRPSRPWKRLRIGSRPVARRCATSARSPGWRASGPGAGARRRTWWDRARSVPVSARSPCWRRRVSRPGRSWRGCSSGSAPWRPTWPTSTPSWA